MAGKSSGGFGAMVHAMLRPDVWGAAACHSGDSYFEWCFLPDFPRVARVVGAAGGVRPFLRRFFEKNKRSSGDHHAVMALAMAACFDPQPEHPDGFELPFDLHTGEMNPARWANWLRWDPLRMIPDHLGALRSLRLLFIDCGDRDQYHLQFGARRMRNALMRHGVAHDYEEFPDDHSGIDYRLDVSLPRLQRALAG